MTDANTGLLLVSFGTFVNSIAIVVKYLVSRAEQKDAEAHRNEIKEVVNSNQGRITNLEVGNLADAAALGIQPIRTTTTNASDNTQKVAQTSANGKEQQ